MDIKTYKGRSNVSGSIALSNRYFIVADDEDNELSVFDKNTEKALKLAITLSAVFDGEIEDGKHQEIDLEGGARIDDVYFWIGSHSTNASLAMTGSKPSLLHAKAKAKAALAKTAY